MEIKLSPTRKCPKCGKDIIYKSFKILKQSEREKTTCLKCRPTRTKLTDEERQQRKIKDVSYQKDYRKKHLKRLSKLKTEYANKIKREVFEHYGNKCKCCGENELKFLTLDHKNGRWNEGVKDKKTGKKVYFQARRENFPDTFQILCYNCNCAKGLYGICPHQQK